MPLDLLPSPGASGALAVLLLLFALVIAWYALGQVKWGIFLKDGGSPQAKVLRLLLAIALAWTLVQFISAYMFAWRMLKNLFTG
ncbi:MULTISPECIES: DUF1146 family protein [Kyrpidia]|nr:MULTISPECIES: DUF1146 family protein [Kyrpidia]MCL6576555.1 DUF1146 family protein [Kyrpidia sp.]